MSYVTRSILGLITDPDVRAIAASYLENWQFSDEPWEFAYISCIRNSKYSGKVPDLDSFIVDLHTNFHVSEDDCEQAANILLNYNEPKSLDDAVSHIQSYVSNSYITNGIEIIAAGSDKNFRAKGIESIKTAVNLVIAADTFYDFSDHDVVAKVITDELPNKDNILPSSFSVINKSLTYKGFRKGDLVCVAAACHGADEGIMMYDGSIKISQDIVVGDQLMGPDSLPRNVLELKRGKEELYKVNTYKNESFIINKSHILHLHQNNKSKGTSTYSRSNINVSLDEYLSKSKNWKHDSKLIKSSQLEFSLNLISNLNLDPYFLGILIGDGNYSTKTKVRFYASEIELQNYIEQHIVSLGMFYTKELLVGCYQYYLTSGQAGKPNFLIRELSRLGMTGSKGKTKFIPEEYLKNTIYNRLQLLAGLIDTDGYYAKHKNSYVFSSVSLKLANQVKWLARSLGFCSSISKCQNKTGKSRDIISYIVRISGNVNQIPCKIKDKIAKPNTNPKNQLYHGISSIEPLGIENYYGWVLDNDHLYLDDDFFVHHNSGVGKSTLLVTEGVHFSRLGFKVCHIVLGDLSEADVFLKYLSAYHQVETEKILEEGHQSYLTPEITSYFQNVRVKSLLPDTYDVFQLLAKADQLYAKFPYDVLIVDYDGNIKDSSGLGNSYVESGQIYAQLKGHSMSKNCLVYVASQTKLMHWNDELVSKVSLNDSSKKAMHLDVLIGLGRNKDCPHIGKLNLPKVRRGKSDQYSFILLNNGMGLIQECRRDAYDTALHAYNARLNSIEFDPSILN